MANKIKFSTKDIDGNYEPSDSEEEYTEKEKTLLKKVRNSRRKNDDTEKEILAFDEDEEEEDDDIEKFEADSDFDGENDDGLPDMHAWGKKKKDFYHTGFVDQDYSSYNDKEEEIALQEENEAKVIQMQLAKKLDEADFSLDVFSTDVKEVEDDNTETKTVLQSDLSTLSQREKIRLFKKDSPEFEGLVNDYVERLEECQHLLEPIINYCKDKKIENLPIIEFVKTKNNLILTYCTNVAFYLLLKSKRISIKNHPIVKRLVQLRQLLLQLEERYINIVKPQLIKFLDDIKSGKEIIFDTNIKMNSKETIKKKSKKLNIIKKLEMQEEEDYDDDDDNSDEDESGGPLTKKIKLNESDEDDDEKLLTEEYNNDDDDDEDGGDEKRPITYQIAKNKGLTPRRKKEQRNPRVKHRNKYKKAMIRRKGAVRTVRTETTRYAGEMSGIKSTVRKGIKIK